MPAFVENLKANLQDDRLRGLVAGEHGSHRAGLSDLRRRPWSGRGLLRVGCALHKRRYASQRKDQGRRIQDWKTPPVQFHIASVLRREMGRTTNAKRIMAAIHGMTILSSRTGKLNAMRFNDLWNSVERLGSLVTAANWGVALTLLVAFACTVVAIKASSRKDELTRTEDLHKAEHIAKLDHANLTLRGQVATLEENAANANKDLAGLQKAAADAKAAQQRVELDLSKQQEKTATAEKDLASLKQAIAPRHLTPEQSRILTKLLSGEPQGAVSVISVIGDGDGAAFAAQIVAVLRDAGWPITDKDIAQGAFSGVGPVGVGILVHSSTTVPAYAGRLQQAFFSVGVPLAGVESPSVPEGAARIVVGRKPPPPQ